MPEPAPSLRQLLAFYLEAGVDCALGDEPVDRLAEPDGFQLPPLPPSRRARSRRRGGSGNAGGDGGTRSGRRGVGAGGRDFLGAGSGADRAFTRSAARHVGEFRRLRAEAHRDKAGVRRRQPGSARDVRRRGPRARGGHRGAAVRRTFRQIAGPDDRGHRSRPQQGLYRQRDSVAAARQPYADAAGNPDLPAVHPATDRTGQS